MMMEGIKSLTKGYVETENIIFECKFKKMSNNEMRQNGSFEDKEDANSINQQETYSTAQLQDALWNIYPSTVDYNSNGVRKFFDLTRLMNLKSIFKMKEMLQSEKINLRFYGLDPKIVKAICDALEENTFVKYLDLEGNLLSLDACFHLNQLLRRNSSLVVLNLSGCKLGYRGVRLLHDGIIRNLVLQELILNNCEILDKGMNHLSSSIQENSCLIYLNLKNNGLTNACAKDLHQMLVYNYSLKKLDLSWNYLSNEKTFEFIFDGLIKNDQIKDIDLSWNSLSTQVSNKVILLIQSFLSKNNKLETLRLQNNGITESNVEKIGQALAKNTNLKQLYLGGNPMKSSGALKLIQNITKSLKSGIEELELSHIWINKYKNPSSFIIENNIIKRADFEETIKTTQTIFSPELLEMEILKTVPRYEYATHLSLRKDTLKATGSTLKKPHKIIKKKKERKEVEKKNKSKL